jgi:hypothetical protein
MIRHNVSRTLVIAVLGAIATTRAQTPAEDGEWSDSFALPLIAIRANRQDILDFLVRSIVTMNWHRLTTVEGRLFADTSESEASRPLVNGRCTASFGELLAFPRSLARLN